MLLISLYYLKADTVSNSNESKITFTNHVATPSTKTENSEINNSYLEEKTGEESSVKLPDFGIFFWDL